MLKADRLSDLTCWHVAQTFVGRPNAIRNIDELMELDDPRWLDVKSWNVDATNPVTVFPPDVSSLAVALMQTNSAPMQRSFAQVQSDSARSRRIETLVPAINARVQRTGVPMQPDWYLDHLPFHQCDDPFHQCGDTRLGCR